MNIMITMCIEYCVLSNVFFDAQLGSPNILGTCIAFVVQLNHTSTKKIYSLVDFDSECCINFAFHGTQNHNSKKQQEN